MPRVDCPHNPDTEWTPWGLREHFLKCLTDPEQAAQLEQWRDAARKWWDHQADQVQAERNAVGQEPDGHLTQSYAPHFMGVVVGIPDQLGRRTQLYTFGRGGYLGEPITGVDRMIVDALLSHAKTSLYNQVVPQTYPQPIQVPPPPYYGGAY